MGDMLRLPNGKVDPWQVLLAFLTVVVAITVGVLSYWMILDVPVAAEIFDIRVDTPTVAQGEFLLFEVDYCKFTPHNATVNRAFRDGLLFTTPSGYSSSILEGCGTAHIGVEIPHSLPPSEYYMDVTLTYQVNPIGKREVEYTVGPFTVTGGRNAGIH